MLPSYSPDEILIVDDTAASLKLLAEILKGAGYQVRMATDGELALRSAKAHPPALVLLDIRMPGMDGYEVCLRLKENEKTRSIPVIFLSVLEDEREKVKAFQVGGIDFINKPLHTPEVLARVKNHLTLWHAQLDLETQNIELEHIRNTLEERVKERSAELTQANQALQEQIKIHLDTLEALRKSEMEYRRLVDTANEGICSLGKDYHITFVNARMATMFGYSGEEMLGRLITDFMPEEEHADHQKKLENRLRGLSEVYERRYRHKDGHIVWTLSSATPILDQDHTFQGTFAMLTDITQRKQVEESLKESEERLAQIINFLPDATFAIDLNGMVITWNHAMAELTGIQANEMIGKGSHEYGRALYGVRRPVLINLVLHPDETIEKEYEFIRSEKDCLFTETEIHPQGKSIAIWGIASPLYNSKGQIVGAIESIRDISLRRKAENEIISLNAELEQRVVERTAQLETANKELEAFSYSVSHDLRAPLRHINGYLDMLKEQTSGILDAQSEQYMTAIFKATQRMSQLIDDLLSFSRVGRYSMTSSAVDLNSLVQEVIGELEPETAQRCIHWTIGSLPVVTGDRALLHMALMNLISNAAKFTRSVAAAEIEIGCADGQNDERIIYVKDNGVGFDMAYADKLFGVFQRLHSAEEFEGTGIGLANVRRIVGRHGGRTWAEGQVNQGATFYFSLPAHPQPVSS